MGCHSQHSEENHKSYYKALRCKTLFSALYGTYIVKLNELENVLKASGQAGQTKLEEGFKDVRSRKRHYSRVRSLHSEESVST
jgi:hypothetical protein